MVSPIAGSLTAKSTAAPGSNVFSIVRGRPYGGQVMQRISEVRRFVQPAMVIEETG
jgi:hypothetical protein